MIGIRQPIHNEFVGYSSNWLFIWMYSKTDYTQQSFLRGINTDLFFLYICIVLPGTYKTQYGGEHEWNEKLRVIWREQYRYALTSTGVNRATRYSRWRKKQQAGRRNPLRMFRRNTCLNRLQLELITTYRSLSLYLLNVYSYMKI